MLRKLLLPLFFLSLLALFSSRAYAKPSDAQKVTPDSLEGQNINAAADFIERMGDKERADNIRKWLKDGKIYWSPKILGESGDSGRTDGDNDITLSHLLAHHNLPKKKGKPFDPKEDFRDLLTLAKVLVHEKFHAHQEVWFRNADNGNNDPSEVEAWSSTFDLISSWVKKLDTDYKATPDGDPKKKMEACQAVCDALQLFVNELAYFGQNTYYGADPTPYQKLLKYFQRLLSEMKKQLQALETKAQPASSPETGQLIQEGEKALKEAHASAPHIPRDDECSFFLTGQGVAAGHIFDLEVVNESPRPLSCTIPAGLVLGPSDPAYQAMILGEDTQCNVPPRSSARFPLSGFCLNHGKLPPPAGVKAPANTAAPSESILDDLVVSRKKNEDGSILERYGNGTTVTTYPDGTVVTQNPGGTGTTAFPDGTKIEAFPGGLTMVTRPGGFPMPLMTAEIYHPEGRPASPGAVTRPDSLQSTRADYDPLTGRLIRIAENTTGTTLTALDTITGQTTVREFGLNGELKSLSYQDVTGTTVLRYNMQYDETGRLIGSTSVSSDGTETVTKFPGETSTTVRHSTQYNQEGMLVSFAEERKTSQDEAVTSIRRYNMVYDQHGRLISSTSIASDGTETVTKFPGETSTTVRHSTQYNQEGMLVSFAEERKTSQDEAVTSIRQYNMVYDQHGRLISSTSISQGGSKTIREFDPATENVVRQFEYSPTTGQTIHIDPKTLRPVVTRETVTGKEVSWFPVVEHPEAFASARKIVEAGRQLAHDGRYAREIQDPETYKTGVIQRALWFFGNKVGQDALAKDMEKEIAKLPKVSQPSKEEKKSVISQIWKDVNLTLKEAGLGYEGGRDR